MHYDPAFSVSTLPLAVARRYLNAVFIETGTFFGGGVRVALAAGFPRIITIEVHRPYYDAQRAAFASEARVECVLGDSATALRDVLHRVTCPATFWLDAHAHVEGAGPKKTAILDELATIAEHPVKTHTILVDDRRVMSPEFIAGYDDLWGGVREPDVLSALRTINPDYRITFEDGTVSGDIITAVPP